MRPLALALAALLLTVTARCDDSFTAVPETALKFVLDEEPNLYLQKLGNISDDEGRLSRTYFSPAHRLAAQTLLGWMEKAGMRAWVDEIGNVHGSLDSAAGPSAPVIVTGSHYDTVIDGGKYDGALGIISGIAAAKAIAIEEGLRQGAFDGARLLEETIRARAGGPAALGELDVRALVRAGEQGGVEGAGGDAAPSAAAAEAPPTRGPAGRSAVLLPRAAIEVVGFCDEEGIRFQSTFLGSRALSGLLLGSGMLESTDREGRTIREVAGEGATAGGGALGDGAVASMAIPRGGIESYVEVHMEQGPVLEAEGEPLAPVSAIAGQTRLEVTVGGEQGHAGTVPMRLRRDSLAAASELVLVLEGLCAGGHREEVLEDAVRDDPSLVCTVGSLSPSPNAGNVIAGSTVFTVDIRSQSDANRARIVDGFREAVGEICTRRGSECVVRLKNEADAIDADPAVLEDLSRSASEAVALLREVEARVIEDGERGADAADGAQEAAQGAVQEELSLGEFEGLEEEGEGEAGDPSQSCSASEGDDADDGAAGSCEAPAAAPATRSLVSGAGHDAMVMAEVAPMGMLFVRCRAGVSHSPLEHVEPEDVAAGTAALFLFLRRRL